MTLNLLEARPKLIEQLTGKIALSRKRPIFKRRRAPQAWAFPTTIITLSVATGLIIGIFLVALNQLNHTDSASSSKQTYIDGR